ncbi:MAG TPA: helix-turn-helix domain-containing protein [Candidatus Gemmiger avicola]|uniref:Helix-turn-helix domain-containing protein n=1 Tax=Candidatus Gemmiger avicola TaxID=2838605 RepID=A0A9D2M687_9FIRM|nr:helix-turn-helix domain-containing protein [Candidatus Gemmiger avicola]
MTTAERIKAARKKAGLTQKQLADKLGISFQTIAQWETGSRKPKIDTLRRIASALEVNIAELDESLVVDLGTDIMYRNPDGTSVTASYNTPAGAALDLLMILGPDRLRQMRDSTAKLNEVGKDTAVQRVDELTEVEKYRQNDNG